MVSQRLKILLICDLSYWILGEIAKQLSEFLSSSFHILVLVSHSKDFPKLLRKVQSQFDVIHFMSPWDFFEFADLITKPCVVTLWHMVDWQVFDDHASRIDTLCVGSEQWKILARNHVSTSLPLKRMPFGLDTKRFSRMINAREAFISINDLDEEVLLFGFAGSGWSNEGNRKGIDRLWECFSALKRSSQCPFSIRFMGKHWSTDIVPDRLKDNIYFDFDKPPEDTPEFYSSLDYYVCTSRQEGVPYPVLEAMSCECVVLSTEVGIVPEIIDNGRNGFLLRDRHLVEDFLKAVTHTSDNAELRGNIGSAARKTIRASWEWREVVDSSIFENIYHSAIYHFYHRSWLQRLSYRLSNYIFPIRIFVHKDINYILQLVRNYLNKTFC